MKKLLLALSIAFLFIACASNSGAGGSVLTEKQVKGKSFVGTGGTLAPYTVSYKFNADNTLVRTKNGVSSEGIWTYNEKTPLRPFTIRWLENGKEEGYMALFMQSGNEIILTGEWILSDEEKSIFEKLRKK
ncbi:MAG: hypothetical protein IJR49_03015 [Treponema sp.]|nr:hypothetical protein [Treponema sp.]